MLLKNRKLVIALLWELKVIIFNEWKGGNKSRRGPAQAGHGKDVAVGI